MKSFFDQYNDCKAANLVVEGRFESFEDHPEMLPSVPKKKLTEAIGLGKLTGLIVMECRRFGGDCSSRHEQCRKMREKLA